MGQPATSLDSLEQAEQKRILEVYAARRHTDKRAFFVYEAVHHLVRIQERHRETLRLLRAHGMGALRPLRILDVGCGDGAMLRAFVDWGANPRNLAGIELQEPDVERARETVPHADIRQGSAAALPYPDGAFDLVCQHTVFTSILNDDVQTAIAREMQRVLRPGGFVLWYDFFVNNPWNKNVRGVPRARLQQLFPGYSVTLRRITVAPPIARRVDERVLSIVYPMLAAVPALRTHYLGLLGKPA